MKRNIGLLIVLVVLSLLVVACGSSVSADVNGGAVECNNEVFLPVVSAGVEGTVEPTVTPNPEATSTIPPVRYCFTPVPPTSTIPPVPTES